MVREKRKSQGRCVLACGHLPRILFLTQNVQERSSLLGIVKLSLLTVYMSIAVRNDMHFVLYRYCCEGQYSINFALKCLEKSAKSQGI